MTIDFPDPAAESPVVETRSAVERRIEAKLRRELTRRIDRMIARETKQTRQEFKRGLAQLAARLVASSIAGESRSGGGGFGIGELLGDALAPRGDRSGHFPLSQSQTANLLYDFIQKATRNL